MAYWSKEQIAQDRMPCGGCGRDHKVVVKSFGRLHAHLLHQILKKCGKRKFFTIIKDTQGNIKTKEWHVGRAIHVSEIADRHDYGKVWELRLWGLLNQPEEWRQSGHYGVPDLAVDFRRGKVQIPKEIKTEEGVILEKSDGFMTTFLKAAEGRSKTHEQWMAESLGTDSEE